MSDLLYLIVVSVFIVRTKEQCHQGAKDVTITNCDESTMNGPTIYIDFSKINRPCNCTVTTMFDGQLLVTSTEVHNCDTRVILDNAFYFVCRTNQPSSSTSFTTVDVKINQHVNIRAEYITQYPSEMFDPCLGMQQNGGHGGNVSATCGKAEVSTPIISSTTNTVSAVKSSSVSGTIYTDVTVSTPSNDANTSVNTLLMKSMQDYPKDMTYVIAGSAAGGAIIVACIVVIVVILKTRRRSERQKNRSQEGNTAHTNEVFDNNQELPDNPLYHSSKPMEDSGYNSNQNSQIRSQKSSNIKIDSDYDIPPNNKPVETSETPVAIYAVPKKKNIRIPEANTGDVYAQVCKPSKNAANEKIRKQNQDGLVYMEVGDNKDTIKQPYTKDEIEDSNTVAYAEIKHQ